MHCCRQFSDVVVTSSLRRHRRHRRRFSIRRKFDFELRNDREQRLFGARTFDRRNISSNAAQKRFKLPEIGINTLPVHIFNTIRTILFIVKIKEKLYKVFQKQN